MNMNVDMVDGLTMVPGIVVFHWFAWRSDDFVFKVSALSWVWVCACSMNYHFSGCDRKMLRYDLRAQWVAQAFMTMSSPRPSWPIIIGGILPVRRTGRVTLNGLGAYYFLWHTFAGPALLTLAYFFYIGQFVFNKPWMHSAFHLILHCGGACGAINPVKKYHVPIPGKWAYLVEVVGLVLLLPIKQIFKNSFLFIKQWTVKTS
jgi:hypothetical protein